MIMKYFYLFMLVFGIEISKAKDVPMYLLKRDYSHLNERETQYNTLRNSIYTFKFLAPHPTCKDSVLDVTYGDMVIYKNGKIEQKTHTTFFLETKLSKEEIIKSLKLGTPFSSLPFPFGLRSQVGVGGPIAHAYVYSKQNDIIDLFIIKIITRSADPCIDIKSSIDKDLKIPNLLVGYEIFYIQIKDTLQN